MLINFVKEKKISLTRHQISSYATVEGCNKAFKEYFYDFFEYMCKDGKFLVIYTLIVRGLSGRYKNLKFDLI